MINKDYRLLEKELEHFGNEFCLKNYSLRLTVAIRIKRNFMNPKVLGKFKCNKKAPIEIQLSKKLIDTHDHQTILDVLKHELVHYCCYMRNKPHLDGEYYFESELQRLHISSSGKVHPIYDFHLYPTFKRQNFIEYVESISDDLS